VIRHEATGRMIRPGGLRYPDGWLPEIGTILGPHEGEYLTVVAHENGRALLGPSIRADFTALRQLGVARSPAELDLVRLA
jgi:hypothetical protein